MADEGFRQDLASEPWKVVATDITKVSWSGSTYNVLTAICEFSRFLVAKVVPSESASDLWSALRAIFVVFGYPEFLRSDRGPGYMALKKTFEAHGICFLPCVAERPTANGCIERVHRTFKDEIRALAFEGEDMGVRRAVDTVVRAYNIRPHSSLEMQSPASVFFNRRIRIGLESPSAPPDCDFPDTFDVGEHVWLRRPAGKRSRGESTFLPDKYVVIACKGRSVTLKPLLSDDKRLIMTAASDRVVRCKQSSIDVDHDINNVDGVMDIDSDTDEGVNLLGLASNDLLNSDVNAGDPPDVPVDDFQRRAVRLDRVRRPPPRFGIDDFIY